MNGASEIDYENNDTFLQDEESGTASDDNESSAAEDKSVSFVARVSKAPTGTTFAHAQKKSKFLNLGDFDASHASSILPSPLRFHKGKD